MNYCTECGAVVRDTATCQENLHALLYREAEIALLVPGFFATPEGQSAHFFAVSSYAIQHPRSMGYSVESLLVLKTNLEAAEEIVRQLRLRDMGGIIIIDFIDMLLKSNQDQVVRRLKRELLRDRTKTRVSDVSRLGLVQMTRKNVSQGLLESFSHVCEACEGRGLISELE